MTTPTLLKPVARNSQEAADATPWQRLTFRSIVLSLLLAALFGYCIPIVDFKMSNTFLGAMHMPAGAIAVLLVLLLVVNPLLRLLSGGVAREMQLGAALLASAFLTFFFYTRSGFESLWFWIFAIMAGVVLGSFALHIGRKPLARNEILTVYITCLFSTIVPAKGAETFFVPNILSSFYFATRENKWLTFLTPYLKPWMTPAISSNGNYDPTVPNAWYNGDPVNWSLWMTPLLAWSALILAIHIMHACLGVMLRAQWAQREALSFPLLRLPLELTETDNQGRNGFFRNPLVWVGFGISVFIEMLNGLHNYFPDVPAFPLGLNTSQFFTEAPWNQIGNFQVQIFPAIVGISFLLTSEVSFSLWFFHLFSKGQYIGAYLIGYPAAAIDSPFWLRGWAKGFVGYEQVGAILAYGALLLWTGREHWKFIARRATGRVQKSPDERGEALSYPVAFWGFLLAFTFILTWTIKSGVNWPIAVLMWGFYLAISLVLTRLVAEAGLLFVQTGWMPIGPIAFLVGAGPGHLFDASSAAPASMISCSTMLDMRGFTLPAFLQSFKLAHDQKIAVRPLLALIFACILVSFSIGLTSIVLLGHNVGGLRLANWWATAAGSQPALHAVGFAKGLDTNYLANWLWVGVGGAATWGMMLARSRFAWFPLHPLGLIMMVPFAMHAMWVSIFLGWLSKVLITRFGGSDSYRKIIPLFLGLTLGGIVMVVFWIAIDGWQGRTAHALLPF